MTIRFIISPIFCFATAIFGVLMGFSGDKVVAYNNQISIGSSLELDAYQKPSQKMIALALAKQDDAKLIKSDKSKKDTSTRQKEYIFRAPRQTTSQQPTSQLKETTYQVQVYGSSQSMLSRVRAIEPGAFLKGNLIQVGNFSTQENAEQLLKKLAIKGLWARIVILS